MQGEVKVCSLVEFHLRDILWFRLPLDIYGLLKMVFEFDCSLVVVNKFEVVVEFFEVIKGGCWSVLLL